VSTMNNSEKSKEEVPKKTPYQLHRNKEREEQVDAIKSKFGYQRDSQALSHALKSTYNQEILGKEKNEGIWLDTTVENAMKNLIGNSYLQEAYLFSDLQSLINGVLREWVKGQRSKINLRNFQFKNSLTDGEKTIATAFELEEEDRPLTVANLKERVEMEEKKIKKIVQRFVRNNLLVVFEEGGKKYYHLPRW